MEALVFICDDTIIGNARAVKRAENRDAVLPSHCLKDPACGSTASLRYRSRWGFTFKATGVPYVAGTPAMVKKLREILGR